MYPRASLWLSPALHTHTTCMYTCTHTTHTHYTLIPFTPHTYMHMYTHTTHTNNTGKWLHVLSFNTWYMTIHRNVCTCMEPCIWGTLNTHTFPWEHSTKHLTLGMDPGPDHMVCSDQKQQFVPHPVDGGRPCPQYVA